MQPNVDFGAATSTAPLHNLQLETAPSIGHSSCNVREVVRTNMEDGYEHALVVKVYVFIGKADTFRIKVQDNRRGIASLRLRHYMVMRRCRASLGCT